METTIERHDTPFPNIPPMAITVAHCMRAVVCTARRNMTDVQRTNPSRALGEFLKAVDAGARRLLYFAPSACRHLTADEVALINILSDAQTGDDQSCCARALWLAHAHTAESIKNAAVEAAASLLEFGLALGPHQTSRCGVLFAAARRTKQRFSIAK